jgi:hypothetical protein
MPADLNTYDKNIFCSTDLRNSAGGDDSAFTIRTRENTRDSTLLPEFGR